MAKVIKKDKDKIILEFTHKEAAAIGGICAIMDQMETVEKCLDGHKELFDIMLSYIREYKY